MLHVMSGKQNKIQQVISRSILELCSINLDLVKAKLKISPVGKVTGIDGRVFDIDGKTVLERLIATELELVLNIWHARNGEAAGWFSGFELRSDGIYAALVLNGGGKELLEAKKYKYLSPEYLVDYDTNEVMHIVGVGLVNQPNLLNEALNNVENPVNKKIKNKPVEGDGMKEERAKLTDENKALKEQVDSLTKALKALKKEQHATKIDNAITAGKLAPAKRDFALALSVNSLGSYLDIEAKTFTKTDNNHIDPDNQSDDLGDADCEVLTQLGLNDDKQGE